MEFLVVSLSAHKALTTFLFQVFLLSSSSFLMILTRILFEDSHKSITLRVICNGMAKGNVISVTKVYHFLGFESSCIINNELLGASKSRKDVALKE